MHRLSGSAACGIFPNWGLNVRLLYFQVDSLPLSHQGNPLAEVVFFFFFNVSYLAGIISFGTSSSFLSWLHSFFDVVTSVFTKFLWLWIRSLTSSISVKILTVSYQWGLILDLNSSSSSRIFCFSASLSSLLTSFHFGLSIFMSFGFITGRQKAPLLALLSVCELNSKSEVTHSQQTSKELTW